MNEGIDISFMGAKVAASKNQAASVAVHTLSASYNIAQIAHYRALCAGLQNAQLSNGVQVNVEAMNQYRNELTKHTILAACDTISLILIGLAGINSR